LAKISHSRDNGRPEIRGKSPLELTSYDLKALTIADFFTQHKLPTQILEVKIVVPMV
jgi:hypothetical protein